MVVYLLSASASVTQAPETPNSVMALKLVNARDREALPFREARFTV